MGEQIYKSISRQSYPKRVYDVELVGDYAVWLIEKLVEIDPIMSQSADLGLEEKGDVKLKFSIN